MRKMWIAVIFLAFVPALCVMAEGTLISKVLELYSADLPGYRIGTPVFDSDGELAGLVVPDQAVILKAIQNKANADSYGTIHIEASYQNIGAKRMRANALLNSIKAAPASGLVFATFSLASNFDAKPMGVEADSANSNARSALLIIGRCATKPAKQIFLGCPIPNDDNAWQLITPSDNSKARTFGQFSVGRAGIQTWNNSDWFYIELYAWPADPWGLGG